MPDIKVNLPDGSTASFPNGTDSGVMERAVQQHLGWKSPQTTAAANINAAPAATGDVRPSTGAVAQARQPASGNDMADMFWGKMIPDAAVPALAAGQKYLVDPLNRMAQGGAKVGGALALSTLGGTYAKTHPNVAGAAQGLGELVGGTVSDPRMWPFALEGTAKGALSELAARGFSSQMIMSAATSYPDIKEALKQGNAFEAARLITQAVGSAGLGLLGAKGEARHPAEKAVRSAEEKAAGPTPLPPSKGAEDDMNSKVKEVQNKPLTSTPLGPTSTTGGQQLQIDFTTKAPSEAHAPKETSGASKAANAPVVDRSALIALDPAPFKPKFSLTKDAWTQQMEHDNAVAIDKEIPVVKSLDDPDKVLARVRPPAQGSALADPTKFATEDPQGVPQATSAPPTLDSIPKLFQTVGAHYDHLTDLMKQADGAEHEDHAASLNNQRKQIEQISNDRLGEGLKNLAPKDVVSFRDEALKRAEDLEAQSKAIRDLTDATIKNRGVKAEIADLRRPGGPPKYVVNPETGERHLMQEDNLVGRDARSHLDELQGRVPTSKASDLKVAGKPEGMPDEEWDRHISTLQAERLNLKGQITEAVRQAAAQGISLESMMDAGLKEPVARLNEIQGLLGKFEKPAETGRRTNIAPELGTKGEITAPEDIKSWSLERARLALGTKLKQLPTDEEFFQHADARDEKGRLLRNAASIADKEIIARKLATQGGSIKGFLRGKVQPVSLNPTPDDFLQRARAFKQPDGSKAEVHKVTSESTEADAGFLVRDGKGNMNWVGHTGLIGPNGTMTHSDFAEALLPHLAHPREDTALDEGEVLLQSRNE